VERLVERHVEHSRNLGADLPKQAHDKGSRRSLLLEIDEQPAERSNALL